MDRPKIVTINGAPQPPAPSKEEIKITQCIGMSQWYEKYGELLSKSDVSDRDSRSKAAYRDAAHYLNKAILIMEKRLDEEQKMN